MRGVVRLVNGEIAEAVPFCRFDEFLSGIILNNFEGYMNLLITTQSIRFSLVLDKDGNVTKAELCNWVYYGYRFSLSTLITDTTKLIELVKKYIIQDDDLMGLLVRMENVTKDTTQEELDAICSLKTSKSARKV